jgi:hypothetical protein
MKCSSDNSVSRRAFVRRLGVAGTTVLALGSIGSGANLRAAVAPEPSVPPAPPKTTAEDEGRQEIPRWGQPYPKILNKASVVAAITDYLMQVNRDGYHPDERKVLAVRKSDRTATLRDAVAPVRQEAYYFVEHELFARPGATRLQPGATAEPQAVALVEEIWDPLYIWVAYDLVRSSSAGFRKPFEGAAQP